MAIYLGSTEITPAILSGVDKIYLGSKLVWSAGLPVGTVYNFEYTGSVQSVELPKGKYKLQCWGAQGGTSYGSSSGSGSKGGYSEGVLTLTTKTTLYIFVGGKGSRGSSSSLVNGGWNGGGASVGYSSYNSGDTNGYSYPACGGGATDISTVTSSMSYSGGRTNRSSASLLARCIVAGGGAGGSYRYTEVTSSSTSNKTTVVLNQETNFVFAWSDSSYRYYWASASVSAKAGLRYTYGGTYSTTLTLHGEGLYDANGQGLGWGYTPTTDMTIYARCYVKGDLNSTADGYANLKINEISKVTTTTTTPSSGYSNQSQQGGGTSGKGQYPGTQSAAGSGGAFGLGANQASTNYRYCGGGGGGGWYGGGTGQSDSSTSYVNYSGGGSGFVNTSANSSYRPSGYTGLQLDSGTTTAGNTSHPSTSGGTETGHSGNGYARITVIE